MKDYILITEENMSYYGLNYSWIGCRATFDEYNKFHSYNKPAVITKMDAIAWCKNGLYHRTDGPAIILNKHKSSWYVLKHHKEYQKAANLTDEDMLAIILKYGEIS
jgi:hypothetical protein